MLHYVHLNICNFLKHFAFSINIIITCRISHKMQSSVAHCIMQIRGISYVDNCSHFAEGVSKTSKFGILA